MYKKYSVFFDVKICSLVNRTLGINHWQKMKKFKATSLILFFLSMLLASSCTVTSKQALNGPGGRNSYNTTLQTTTSEQMLLNLVRLRYCDIPYFLDVSTITTQFTYGAKGLPLFRIPGFNNTNPFEFGGELSWQNQPTIQYTPLEGQQFAMQLMKPIDILTIQHLIISGWDVDRVFKLTIQAFDELYNAPNAAGPIPDRIPEFEPFFEMTKLLREFQLQGNLHVGSNVVKMKNGEDYTDKKVEDSDDCNYRHKFNSMRLIYPSDLPGSKRLAELLAGSKRSGGRYILDIDLGFNKDAEMGLMPRSVLGCMYYLSLGIVPPARDVALGNVPLVKDKNGKIYNWQELLGGLFTVSSSENYPSNPYIAVKYNGYWFYIDNNDICTKRTFVLLQLIYSLQSNEAKQLPTLLSIPLGG